MALFSEEMLLQGHFPLKFWVRSSWKESHMFESECQVFFLQCSYESQMLSCLFHECHHGQQVQGAWKRRAPLEYHGRLRYTCFELWSGPRDFGLRRKEKLLLIQWNMGFVNTENTSWGQDNSLLSAQALHADSVGFAVFFCPLASIRVEGRVSECSLHTDGQGIFWEELNYR